MNKWNLPTIKDFWKEEDGAAVVEVILILVVVIGLVVIFKKQITDLVNNIFESINKEAKQVYS
jgi:Flp pilus assembly pilin Flp